MRNFVEKLQDIVENWEDIIENRALGARQTPSNIHARCCMLEIVNRKSIVAKLLPLQLLVELVR
jgi:hypothetical protein